MYGSTAYDGRLERIVPSLQTEQRGTNRTRIATLLLIGVLLGIALIIFYNEPAKLEMEVILKDPSFGGASDEITGLPGIPHGFKTKQYSGYLDISNGGKLHYWLVESQRNPTDDPVVMWLNGGPGASSLGGLLYENGPLRVNDDGETLRENAYSWNKFANLLYFDAPVGVGFSYNTSGVYESNDFLQAEENYEALLHFFMKFPHLRKNDFHITGESYGGVYVPTTAKAIVEGNERSPDDKINIKSFAIGNGVNEYQANSRLFFAYYHGLIGHDLWIEIRKMCPSVQEFTLPANTFFDATQDTGVQNNTSDTCASVQFMAFSKMMSSHVNSYDIYRKCSHGDPLHGIDTLLQDLMEPANVSDNPHPITQPISLPMTLCLNNTGATNYLNQPRVKDAIHVPANLTWGNIVMTNITGSAFRLLNLSHTPRELKYGMPLKTTVVPIWKFLLKNNVRGVVYHGDVDLMCDFIGGQWAVEAMELPVITQYQPWYVRDVDGTSQVGGFAMEFPGLSFVTIRGAGHMAPQWKPKETMHMYEKYILGPDTAVNA